MGAGCVPSSRHKRGQVAVGEIVAFLPVYEQYVVLTRVLGNRVHSQTVNSFITDHLTRSRN